MDQLMDECIHGLAPDTCSPCIHGPSGPRPPPSVVSTFSARYDGDCVGCTLPIYVGQVIHGLSNGLYAHQGCL